MAGARWPVSSVKSCGLDRAYYLTGTARYILEHRILHVAITEIAFNATSAGGRPLAAAVPVAAPEPSVEDILRQRQRDGEFRDFDVGAVAGVVRSAVTHAMVMAQSAHPGADLDACAGELVRLFDLGIRR